MIFALALQGGTWLTSKAIWLRRLLPCLLLAAAGQAHAGFACVFSEPEQRGERRCFEADKVVDIPEGVTVNSVQLARDVELVAAGGTAMSGNLTRFLASSNYRDLYGNSSSTFRSFHAIPRACIYQNRAYGGRDHCLSPGPLDSDLTDSLDRQASSVILGPGIVFYAFAQQQGKGESLYRYNDSPSLGSFDNKARSIQVLRRNLNCFEDCVIGYNEGYDLSDVFRHAGARKLLPSQVVLTFEVSSQQAFNVYASNAIRIAFYRHSVRMVIDGTDRDLGGIDLPHNAAFVSVVLGFDTRDHLDVQLIASDSSRGFLAATPIATVARLPSMLDSALSMESESTPIRLKSLSMGTVAQSARTRKASGCWNREILALATWFLGPCSDGTGNPATDLIRFVAGAKPNGNFTSLTPSTPATTSAPDTNLASYSAMGNNPMAIHAAARVCRANVAHIAVPRMKRGVDSPANCVERTMTLIALFQALFGPQWSAENFQQVVSNILTHGTTGYASSNPELESQLVDAVRQRARDTASDTRRQTAMAAFYAADQLFETSRLGTLDLEVAAARMNSTGSREIAQSADAPATLADARSAPLGLYQLDLREFRPRTIAPRVLREGRWVDSLDPFTFQVLNWNDIPSMLRLSSVLQSWRDDYRIFSRDNSLSPGQVSLSATGRNMAASMVTSISEGEPGIYVLVLFRGVPVSALVGSIDEDDPTRADVGTVVSHPLSVTYANRDGTVRGAASAGLQHFLTYLQQRGVRTVETSAITKPSALVKKRAGFQLLEPASDSDSSDESNRRRR